jgi:beta-phosphoglucomutase
MGILKAFIFDLNGTMIDDMEYHTKAWYQIINDDLGTKLSKEEVRANMYGKNAEVLTRIFGAGHFTDSEIKKISDEKEKRYQKAFLPHLKLLPGLTVFLQKAGEQKIKMAIGSAAITFNIDFVLDNLGIRHYFDAIVSADQVHTSKPDPETFVKAASLLHTDPSSCIVFEDVPKGVEAALNAGMQCVALTTMHTKDTFNKYPNVIASIKDYTDPICKELLGQDLLSSK